jgi:hypothetical protein
MVVFVHVRSTVREYPDGNVRETVNERITYSAGEQQLFEHNTFQVYFDAEQQIERYTGVPFRIVDESGRDLQGPRQRCIRPRRRDVWEHGPHPSLHDTSDRNICDDLSE